MNYWRKFLAVLLTAGMLATAYPASAATPQAADSPAFLAQVASVLDTIQKTLRSLAAAIQSIADGDASGNVAATPSPAPSPVPFPTPYSQPSVPATPVPQPTPTPKPTVSPPPSAAAPSANAETSVLETQLNQLREVLRTLELQVAAQKATPTPAPQLQSAPTAPRLNAPAASPRVVTTAAGTFARTGDPNAPQQPEYVPGNAIIKLKDTENVTFARGVDGIVTTSKPPLTQIFRTHRVSKAEKVFKNKSGAGLGKINLLTFPQDVAVSDVVAALARDPAVEYAEPNFIAKVTQTSAFQLPTPNDPLYAQQWHLPKVSARQAWGVTQGSQNVVIAVIDTGVYCGGGIACRFYHEDLGQNMWENTRELIDGLDNDGNGFIDDKWGWDFVDAPTFTCFQGEDCVTRDNIPNGLISHATHVAGIAAAVTNNSVGVAGVCPQCKIMNLRAGFGADVGLPEPYGLLQMSDIETALAYAADNGAKVINMSFATRSYVQSLKDAIDYAYGRGAILVAAAGNDNWSRKNYPAAYPNVISVAMTDPFDGQTGGAYGGWIDIAAPGRGILSTTIPQTRWSCPDPDGDGYGVCSGTSMAAPVVAGGIGLALSRNPAFTQEQIRTLIHSSYDPVFSSRYIGAGRINLFKMVSKPSIPLAKLDAALADMAVSARTPLTIRGTAMAPAGFRSYRVEFGAGAYPTQWSVIQGDTTVPVSGGVLATWNLPSLNLPGGVYTIRLLVTDQNGVVGEDKKPVTVDPDLVAGWPKYIPGGYPYPRRSPWDDNLSAPTLFDVDSDGDGEMFFSTLSDGGLSSFYAIDHNGILLSGRWPVSEWTGTFSRLSPAVADIDGDFVPETVFGRTNYDQGTQLSKLFVYRSDGTLKPEWPVTLASQTIMMTGSPVIANVDGGNDLEIIAVTTDYTFPLLFPCNTVGNKVFVYKQNGQLLPGWPQTVVCPPEATPAVGDVDGDGNPEIVVQTNGMDALLYVFKRDGTQLTGWPRTAGAGGMFAPVLADIDRNDGGKLEIMTTSSDGNLYASNHDGTGVSGWPFQLTSPFNTPVVVDLDGDSYPEVIIADNFKLYVLNRNGTPFPGWIGGRQLPNNRQEPVAVTDLDGDGRKEILLISFLPSTVYGFRFDGTTIPNFPKQLPSTLTPSLYPFSLVSGDFNGNGIIDAFMLDNSEDGYMYLWEFSGPATPQALSGWPQFSHDERHTGHYEPYIPQQ